jgi:hypothetical protein
MFDLGPADYLNAREQAVLFWLIVSAALVLWKVPAIRPQLPILVRSALSPKLLFGIWVPATIYVAVVVYLAAGRGLWHATSLRETLYWFAGTAFVLAGSATQASDPLKFWSLFGRVLKVTILIEFLVNLYVFPLPVELIFIPLGVLLAGTQAVSEGNVTLASAHKVVSFLLTALGLATVVYALSSAVRDFHGLVTWVHFEQFVMPLALTAAFAPFLYYVALWSTYEQVFIRMDIYGRDDQDMRRAKWAMFRVCRLNLRKVGRLSTRFFPLIRSVSPDASTGVLIRAFQRELRVVEQGEQLAT